jgi:hypothetical protein
MVAPSFWARQSALLDRNNNSKTAKFREKIRLMLINWIIVSNIQCKSIVGKSSRFKRQTLVPIAGAEARSIPRLAAVAYCDADFVAEENNTGICQHHCHPPRGAVSHRTAFGNVNNSNRLNYFTAIEGFSAHQKHPIRRFDLLFRKSTIFPRQPTNDFLELMQPLSRSKRLSLAIETLH